MFRNLFKNRIKMLLFLLSAASIGAILFYVFSYTRMNFHSDTASMLLLGREQIEQKKFFPKDFCYSTGVFVFNLNILITPLMLFINDWILCRQIAIIIFLVTMYFLAYKFFVNAERKAYIESCLLIILFSTPFMHMEETYFEAAYLVLGIYELFIFISLSNAIKKNNISSYILLSASLFVANVDGTRNIIIMFLPLIISIVLEAYVSNNFKIKINKKLINIIISIIAGVFIGFTFFMLISNKVNLNSVTASMRFQGVNAISDNINKFIANLLEYYNLIGDVNLLSIKGITLAFNIIFFVISMIIIPFIYLYKYKYIKNYLLKIYILYSWISNLFVIYMMIFTTANTQRYLQTVFFHNCMLTAVFVADIFKKNIKNCNYLILTLFFLLVGLNHFNYFNDLRSKLIQANQKEQLYEYLLKENLTFGYSTYWNAYKNIALTNGEVIIAAWADNPNVPYYWLTNKKWYNPSYHKGETFILLSEEEIINPIYYYEAREIKHFDKFTILIYDQNIYGNEKILDYINNNYYLYKPETKEISISEMIIDGNCVSAGNILYLMKGGTAFSPYKNLSAGEYQIKISGSNIDKSNIMLDNNMNQGNIKYDILEINKNEISICFTTLEPIENFQLKLIGVDKNISISSILISSL